MECIHKSVNDLGVAAYILMHGYTFLEKHDKAFFFECENEEAALEFDSRIEEYQPPNEYYTFDSCLMYLKKINERVPKHMDDSIHKVINDLGAAAYILMHEYRPKPLGARVIGKRGKYVYFKHPEGKSDEFHGLYKQYLPSQFQVYDSSLMALKKMADGMHKK